MPKYIVRVTATYPVDAINAEDALSTVPIAVRIKGSIAEALTEIVDASTQKVVLTAKLNPDKEKR